MKLLIVTQKVDSADPILGFFHGWLREFSHHCEAVTVLSQGTGSFNLPGNVRVKSLGKEKGKPKLAQIITFWVLAWKERASYEAVFVHMTPIWVLLGAPLWILLGKRMYLWYEIRRGSLKLSLALFFVRKVFAATEHGLPSHSERLVVTGHGIDTAVFHPQLSKVENIAVAVGRVTAVKRYDLILNAFAALPSDMRLIIAGDTVTQRDHEELTKLKSLMSELGVSGRVVIGWVPPSEVPALLRRAKLFLHAAEGGLDKALLEAMASGCPPVSTSIAAQKLLPEQCRATVDQFTGKAQNLLALSDAERQRLGEDLRSRIERGHGLPVCIMRLVSEMQP